MLLCTELAVGGQSLAVLPNNLDQLVSTAGKRPQESKVEQPKAHEQIQSSAQVSTSGEYKSKFTIRTQAH